MIRIINEYANLALTRVFEQEHVSYLHFVSVERLINDASVYKSRVESSDVRWTPEFGSWPESITEITYQDPYRYRIAIFYDEGSGWTNDFRYETIILHITIWILKRHLNHLTSCVHPMTKEVILSCV